MTVQFEFVDEEVGEGREVIVVKAEMIPLNTSTMTKFNDMVSSCLQCQPLLLVNSYIYFLHDGCVMDDRL